MVINSVVAGNGPGAPGYALLIDAAPARGALIDAGGVLPALAAVPPSALLGTPTGSVVQLVGADNPQAVLAALRTAAAHEGQVVVLVVGQVVADRRGQPHLALARTTPRTVRYTALPWHWLAGELQHRPQGSTSVVADLVAAPEVWDRREELDVPHGVALFGMLTAPPPRRRTALPHYMRSLAALLRATTVRPPLGQLHHQVLQHVALDPHDGDRVLVFGNADATADGGEAGPEGATALPRSAATASSGGDGPTSADPVDPYMEIRAAVQAGRHHEAEALAATHEQTAILTGGPHSVEALRWGEVRADLAWLGGRFDQATELWIRVGRARLTAGQDPGHPDVARAVDHAHHCWLQVQDPGAAIALGTALVPLRHAVPGAHHGSVAALEARLRHLTRVRERNG